MSRSEPIESSRRNTNGKITKIIINIPDKKETQHVELINSEKDHKRWTSFVLIGSKVCQLLQH